MKKIIFLAVFSMGVLIATADTIYVNSNAAPGGTGVIDWGDAFDDLQDAIDSAQSGDEIWVAAGTYYPTQQIPDGNSNRDKAFFVYKKNIKIYGGFPASGSPLWADRDSKQYETILSGNNDVILIVESENVILDGF